MLTQPHTRTLGRPFAWLWGAYAVSALGTWLAFDAFSLVAILVLHAGPAAVSGLAATGLAVGAVIAVPLGPWMEFRRKRPVMIAMDLIRFVALASVPIAYALNALTFVQLLVVAVVVGAADIAFKAASGACVKALIAPEDLLVANGRLESTTWTATMLGPPVGGLAIGLLGPVTTMIANAISFILSAAGIRAIGAGEPAPAHVREARPRPRELLDGWRYIFAHPELRRLFLNAALVNSLILATLPLIAVLMLGRLGFPPWQYGLAFAAPCVGGLIGSRIARPLVARHGRRRVLLGAGVARVCWSIGLAFVGRGLGGLALVMAIQLGLVTCCGVFNPVLAAYRLEQLEARRVARTLTAWSVGTSGSTAAFTVLWGLLAHLLGIRPAIALAGALMLVTPALLVSPARLLRPVTSVIRGVYGTRRGVARAE